MLGVGEGGVVFGWRGLSTPKHLPPQPLKQKGQLELSKNNKNTPGHHVMLLCEPQKSKKLMKVCLHSSHWNSQPSVST